MSHLIPRSQILYCFEAILHAPYEGQWDKLESLVQPTVSINNESLQRDAFIAHLRSNVETNTSSKLDSSVVDVEAQAIAARIIKTQSTSSEEASTAQPVQFQEIMLAWFTDGRLSAIKSLQDNDARRARVQSAIETPTPLLESSSPTTVDLASTYRQYIGSINDKTMEATFGKFCKPLVTHNNHEKTISDYISLIQESQEAIQGLYFYIQDLFVDKVSGRVAARLEFTGVPVKTWANAEPNGQGVKFHEHVMYWFDEGKIHW
ncbi:hypothetical protein ACLX1H_010990 [Fusarium chlamydosporum]